MKCRRLTKRRVALVAAVVLALPCMLHALPPSVSNVQVTQDYNRLMTISYTLEGAGAIVTMDVLTNGVSIGRALYANATGDVNVKVPEGNRTIAWQPRETWPDQKIRDRSLSVKLTVWALDNPPDYMCVDLTKPSTVVWYISSNDVPGGVTADIYKTDKLLMRRIHADGIRWRMGLANDATKQRAHHVTLTNDYYIGIYTMTYAQRNKFYTAGGESGKLPDNSMSYHTLRGSSANWPNNGHTVEADSLIGKLRTHSGIDTFDLPTEAEWEYACRAGTATRWSFGDSDANAIMSLYAWYNYTGSVGRHEPGLLLPNPWGLYDMHGNMWEWCLDWYSDGDAFCKTGDDVIAPVGPVSGSNRCLRGGSYAHYASHARSANRDGGTQTPGSPYQTIGYRLVCLANFNDAE